MKAVNAGLVLVIVGIVVGVLWFGLGRRSEEEVERLVVVVPHHGIKKDLRMDFWREECEKYDCGAVETVVLLSPNHFDINQERVVYSEVEWTVSDGILENYNGGYEGELLVEYEVDEAKVREDHGIVSLVGEVREFFPGAKLAPFLIGNRIEFAELGELNKYIEQICERSCAVVGSVDFSHNVKEGLAREQDERTVRLLGQGDLRDGELWVSEERAEVDSPQVLYLLQHFGNVLGREFGLWRRTSSNEMDMDAVVTSHVLGYWE